MDAERASEHASRLFVGLTVAAILSVAILVVSAAWSVLSAVGLLAPVGWFVVVVVTSYAIGTVISISVDD